MQRELESRNFVFFYRACFERRFTRRAVFSPCSVFRHNPLPERLSPFVRLRKRRESGMRNARRRRSGRHWIRGLLIFDRRPRYRKNDNAECHHPSAQSQRGKSAARCSNGPRCQENERTDRRGSKNDPPAPAGGMGRKMSTRALRRMKKNLLDCDALILDELSMVDILLFDAPPARVAVRLPFNHGG